MLRNDIELLSWMKSTNDSLEPKHPLAINEKVAPKREKPLSDSELPKPM